MTDWPGITRFIDGGGYTGSYYAAYVGEQVVTSNDTITLTDFVNWAALAKAVLIRNDTGAEITNSVSNNVITVTEAALIKVKITIFAFGRRNIPGA